jgi:hypothetical protein
LAGFLFEINGGLIDPVQSINCSSLCQPLAVMTFNPSTSKKCFFKFQQFTTCNVLNSLLRIDVIKLHWGRYVCSIFAAALCRPDPESLTHIFNQTIISGTIPKIWKANHVQCSLFTKVVTLVT